MALPVRRSDREPDEPERWDSLDELHRLNQRLSGYLESWRRLPDLLGGAFTPLADVEETPEAYVIEIELPGVKRDDLDIEIAGQRVSVHGERKEKNRIGILRRRERTIGRFSYEVTLPGDVDDNGVQAQLDDGVLTVRVAKPQHARPRRIQVRC